MAGYLHLAQTARAAHARVRAARDLESRWTALPPERQEEARAEWTNVKDALTAVRTRMEAGPRGFVREFKAGLAGTESEPVAPPRPLGELAGELHVATNALRDKLNAIES
jgi:hypothetical protein